MSEHLERRIADLEQELQAAKVTKSRKKLIIWLGVGVIIIAIAVGSTAYILKKSSLPASSTDTNSIRHDGLPTNITRRADFPVLYPTNKLPNGITLNQQSVQLTNSVLIFQLSGGQSSSPITITEQSLPSNLQNSVIQGKEKVDGAEGNATISYDGTRVIGYLISKDKKSFVILSSPTADNAAVIKVLLQSFRPLR